MDRQNHGKKNAPPGSRMMWMLAAAIALLSLVLIGLVILTFSRKSAGKDQNPSADLSEESALSDSSLEGEGQEEAGSGEGEENRSSSEENAGEADAVTASEKKADGTETESTEEENGEPHVPVIGIAWRSNSGGMNPTNVIWALEEIGIEPVYLPQVYDYDLSYTDNELDARWIDEHDILNREASELVKANTWHHSNAEKVMEGIDGIVFAGGGDISPNLYANPVPWHGIEKDIDYYATRDVSDYVLMSYCIDQDIPMMGLCRGLQMLAVISGSDMIQDLETYYKEQNLEYGYDHRMYKESPEAQVDYARHDVWVTDQDSIFARIIGSDVIRNTPSWHHQTPVNLEGTKLKVTGVAHSGGIDVIEAVERTDKRYCHAIQFHPEISVKKVLLKEANVSDYTDYETALLFYRDLVRACSE